MSHPEQLPWIEQAACRTVHPEVFFAEQVPAHALATCRACPVQADCLTYALDLQASANWHGLHGVWGGTTEAERRRMLTDRVGA